MNVLAEGNDMIESAKSGVWGKPGSLREGGEHSRWKDSVEPPFIQNGWDTAK